MKERGGLRLDDQVPGCPPAELEGQAQCQGENKQAPGVYSRGGHIMLLLSESLLAKE